MSDPQPPPESRGAEADLPGPVSQEIENKEEAMLRALSEARTLLAQKDYLGALSKAVEATRLCPCGTSVHHHPRDKSCHIQECIETIEYGYENGDNIFGRKCRCDFLWPYCDRPSHVEAVDMQADCSVKAGRHAAAFSIALGLIRMDPKSPAGYCRAVMIMRHLVKAQLDPQGPETRSLKVLIQTTQVDSVNNFAELIKPLIKFGLDHTSHCRHAQDIKFRAILKKMAHHMGMNEAKADPITKLPPELLSMIFSYMDLSSLLRCMRVAKRWKRMVLWDHMLWRELRIKHPGNPKKNFAKFISERRSIRVLVLDEIAEFSLTAEKAQILARGLPWLRRLQLGTTMNRPDRLKVGLGGLSGKYMTRLTHLRLSGVGLPLMRDLTQLASLSLESIDLRDTDCDLLSALPSRFPNLKRLRMRSTQKSCSVDLGILAYRTPALQHLYLDGCRFPTTSVSEEFGVWNDLRTLVIGERTAAIPPTSPATILTPAAVPVPLFSSKIESLTLLSPDFHLPFLLLFPVRCGAGLLRHHPQPPPLPTPMPTLEESYPHLRVFRCHMTIAPHFLEWTLAPSLANKTLEVLDLGHGNEYATYDPGAHTVNISTPFGAPSRDPAEEYPFLAEAGCESVRTLGFWNFNFAPVGDATGFGFAPVLGFLSKFPGVDTVAVYPGAHGVWVLVMELIETGRVKKVVQDRLQGVDWTSMQELARRKGVEVVHVPRDFGVDWDAEGW